MVCIFDPACELLPPWTKELQYTCVLLPLYCTFSLTSSSKSRKWLARLTKVAQRYNSFVFVSFLQLMTLVIYCTLNKITKFLFTFSVLPFSSSAGQSGISVAKKSAQSAGSAKRCLQSTSNTVQYSCK
jgi:hypothetical protein